MNKKRILYMTTSWNRGGGIESYMWNFMKHIDQEQYAIDIAFPGEFKWQNEDALTEKGISVIHYPAKNLRQQIKVIKTILKNGDYDIVHVMQHYLGWETHTIFALVAIAERAHHHYKVICHAHNKEDTTRTVKIIRKTVRGIFRTVLRSALSRADLLAACSGDAGDFVYGRRKKVETFYNGIDVNKFIAAADDGCISQWQEKYGIDANRTNFVIVARMDDQKNPLFVLDVIQAVSWHCPDVNLIWVGEGGMRKDIEAHIEELGIADRVQLLGMQDHVEEILACCDYFLLPSKYEGLGIVFIEAQAAGLHCFASDRVPAEADCGGVTFIELDKTAEQWAEGIFRQIKSGPQTTIDMERLDRFEINRTVAELCEVYNRLVES